MTEATITEKIENASEIFSKKTSIRRFVKEQGLHLDDVDKMIRRMSMIRDEMEEAEEQAEKERKEHEQRLKEAEDKLKESGINISELVDYARGNGVQKTRKYTKRSARDNPVCLYRYKDSSGKNKDVQLKKLGRPTEEFSEYLKANGLKKKDCLIKELSESEVVASSGSQKKAAKKEKKEEETA